MATKPMQYWNGRDPKYLFYHAMIAARTKAEAIRLGKAALDPTFNARELDTYWVKCWGTTAQQVIGLPTEEGIYVQTGDDRFFKFIGAGADAESSSREGREKRQSQGRRQEG
jgi:hypothetical protein